MYGIFLAERGRGGPEEGGGETIFGKSDAKLEGPYLGLVKVTNV